MGRLQAADGRLARAERGLKWAALGAADGRYTAGLLRKGGTEGKQRKKGKGKEEKKGEISAERGGGLFWGREKKQREGRRKNALWRWRMRKEEPRPRRHPRYVLC